MKPVILTNFCIFLTLICVTNAKNVLMIQCVFAQSYSYVLQGIALVLAEEHNVTLLSRHPLYEAHPNITLIPIGPVQVDVGAIFKDLYEIAIRQDDTSQFGIDAVLFNTKEYVEELMDNPAVKYIFQSKNTYDILIMPTVLSGPYLRLAHFLDVPLVQVATSYPMPWQNNVIGNPNHISTDSSLLLPPNSESFYGRLTKFIQGIKLLFRYHFQYLPILDKYSAKYYPPDTPNTEDILKNTSLLLSNTQEAMVMLRPKVSNFVEIGGLHCRPAKDLPPDIKDFIQSAGPEGLIYMSLGLTVQSTFPQHILKGILNVFGKLPQKVIFKMGQEVDDVPSNVLILRSSPQQDILGHPNTKLFIMQGGMLSLQEAVFHEVPVLILPLTLDQPSSAIVTEKLGYGRYLRFSQFSEEAFYREISEVLSNPKYSKRVKELSVLTNDLFKDPKENLKWWINYVIRHRGSPLSKYNRHEYNPSTYHIDLDILLFLLFVALGLFVLSIFIIICILRNVTKYSKIKKD